MQYRVMYIVAAERGNTNEDMDVVFQDLYAEGDNPLVYLADKFGWQTDDDVVLAVGIKVDSVWRIMSANEYTLLVQARKEAKEEVEVEKMLDVMAAFPGTTAWHVGDYVAWPLGKESYCIGWIRAIDAGVATLVEANAFHRVWGSSSTSRGQLHHIPLERLHSCPTYYKHIVRDVKEAA